MVSAFPERLRSALARAPLRWVLVVPFVLQIAGAVGLVGYYSYRSGQVAVADLAAQLMDAVSHRVRDRLDTYLQLPQQTAAAASRLSQRSRRSLSDLEPVRSYLWQQMNLSPLVSANFFVTPQGEHIGYQRLQDQALVDFAVKLTGENLTIDTLLLAEIRLPQLHERKYYLVDHQGEPKKLIYTLPLDQRAPAQRIFRLSAPIARQQQTWSPVFISPLVPLLGVYALAPVYNAAGQWQGTFAVDCDLSDVSAYLRQVKISPSGQIFIVDRAGFLVATSTPETPFIQSQVGQFQRLMAVDSTNSQTRAIAQQLVQRFGRWQSVHHSQHFQLIVGDQQQFVGILPYQDDYGLDWLVVTVVPATDLMTEIAANNARTIWLSWLILGFATGLGIVTARWIVAPLQQLNRSALQIAQGHLDQNIPSQGVGEVSQLAIAFQQMATQLQASFAALQTSRQTLSTLLDTIPIGISVFAADGRLILLNQAGQVMFSQDSLMNRSVAEIVAIHPLYVAGTDHPYPSDRLPPLLGLQGQTVRVDDIEIDVNGQRVPLTTHTIPVMDTAGNVVYAITLFQDITEQRQAEQLWENYQRDLEQQVATRTEELTQARDLWAAIFNQSTDAIFLTDAYPSTQILDCNERAVELFEAPSKDGLIGMKGTALQKAPYSNDELAEISIELARYGFWIREIELVTNAGRSFWGNLAVKPIQLGEKQLRLIRVTDISDRKAIEFTLQQSQARMQNLAMTLPGTIYSYVMHVDGTASFEYLNPAIEKLTELTLEECLADPEYTVLGVMHPDDRPNYLAAVAQSAATLHSFSYEWRIITPSGRLKWLRAASQPERRPNGDICWHGLVLDISEAKFADADRVQAEADLRESEERFRQIAATIDQLFFVRHAYTGQFLYISPAYEKMWGRSCESLYDDPDSWLEAIHPEDRAQVINSLEKEIAGDGVSREYRIVRPDGAVRWIMAQVSPILNDSGELVRYAGFAVDITDRKQVEEQLRDNEATNRALLQAIPDLLIRMRRDGTYLDIRHGGVIKLFNPSATYIGAHISQSMPETAVQERLFYIEEALRMREVRIYEQRLRIEDEIYYEEVRIVPCAEDEVLMIVRDISSRKRTEAALRESEERFRRAFDDAAVGMTLVALDGRFLSVNRALCEMVGYRESELLQRTYQDITYPDDLEIDFIHVQKVLAGEMRSFQLEKRYIHKQGHIVWVLLSVSMVQDQNGVPLYFVSQIQDISDRHKIDRLKDEFISMVSHELRTPLTAIRGSLGILETGVFDHRPAQARHMLQVALNNSDRLVRLVNDILDLERLESGKVLLVMQRCQVADLMQQAVELVQTIATQANISLQMTPLVTEIIAAPDAIVQTLTNLLSNAIKFSAAGSTVGLTAVICLPEHLPGDLPVRAVVRFAVKDQGRGIPADKIETIFGRFQQVDVSDARQKGGTGLGLAICESIVRQHNGQIWAESILGEGSTFYFTIPLGEESPVLMEQGAGFG